MWSTEYTSISSNGNNPNSPTNPTNPDNLITRVYIYIYWEQVVWVLSTREHFYPGLSGYVRQVGPLITSLSHTHTYIHTHTHTPSSSKPSSIRLPCSPDNRMITLWWPLVCRPESALRDWAKFMDMEPYDWSQADLRPELPKREEHITRVRLSLSLSLSRFLWHSMFLW